MVKIDREKLVKERRTSYLMYVALRFISRMFVGKQKRNKYLNPILSRVLNESLTRILIEGLTSSFLTERRCVALLRERAERQSDHPQIYVGILIRNCVRYTLRTLSSFHTQHPHNWIIVDNASTDGTVQLLSDLEKIRNQIIIRNPENKGVAPGFNQILRRALEDAECKYIFLVNNDIILEPDTLDTLLEFLKANTEYLIVSARNTRDFKKEPKILDNTVDFPCCLLTRACVEKVGFFDENFVMAYFEDNDYHERVKRAGIKNGMVCYAGYYHVGSRTIHEGGVQVSEFFDRNKEYFRKKWGFTPS